MPDQKNRKLAPIWRDTAFITAIAGLLAIIIPGTAAINGMFRARADAQRQLHEIRVQYLDRAIDPEKTPLYRESVLEFLVRTFEPNDPMRVWAEKRLDNLRAAREKGKAFEETARILTKIASKLKKVNDDKEVEKLKSELEKLEKKLESAQAALKKAEKEAFISEQFSKMTSELLIESFPSGAEVFLNRQFSGISPLLVKVPVGVHDIEVRKEGYVPLVDKIMIERPGRVTWAIKLARLKER